MFAKNLQDNYFHTAITCALYKGIEKVNVLDRKDFNSDIVNNVDNTMLFLQQHIPVRYEFDGSPRRIEIPEIPLEALREGDRAEFARLVEEYSPMIYRLGLKMLNNPQDAETIRDILIIGVSLELTIIAIAATGIA